MASSLAEPLISALTRRRASGEVVATADAGRMILRRMREWEITRAVIADDPVLVSIGLPDLLAEEGIEALVWPTGLPVRELLGLDGPTATCGVSVPMGAVAERGSLLLAAGPGQGRALDAAAAYHIAVLPAERISRTLDEALATAYGSGRPPSALSLVSAPSRTSDIEKISTLGAHGALGLHLTVLEDPGPE